jgi:hypothetical protein
LLTYAMFQALTDSWKNIRFTGTLLKRYYLLQDVSGGDGRGWSTYQSSTFHGET